MEEILSKDNQYIKLLASLQQSKRRRQTGLTIVEGVRAAEEALRAGVKIEIALIEPQLLDQQRAGKVIDRLRQQGVNAYAAVDNLLARAAATEHSQGIILAVHYPTDAYQRIDESKCDFLLIADNIADPGNLGTIIRSAEAAAVDGLILTGNCTDWTSPKVMRAAMGATLRLPIWVAKEKDALSLCRTRGVRLLLTAADGELLYWQEQLAKPHAYILGAEASGVGEFWRAAADTALKLPMAKGCESLNVAVAAAVLLYQTVQQRYDIK